MSLRAINFPSDGTSVHSGMGDFLFLSPDKAHRAEVIYEGEPPFGDSFHALSVDDVSFPGHVWGCNFAWSPCSRYLVCSWMPQSPEKWIRRTIIIDIVNRRYFHLLDYFYDFIFDGVDLVEVVLDRDRGVRSAHSYTLNGGEVWIAY